MTEKKKTKKKFKKSAGRTILTWLVSLLMIGGVVFFAISINKEVKTTFSLSAELAEVKAELEALEKEKEELTIRREKLTDENYISSVARGKYLIFKENEQVYYLPPLDNDGD